MNEKIVHLNAKETNDHKTNRIHLNKKRSARGKKI